MNGGYKIIDLDGYSLTIGGDSVTIPGIYNSIAVSKKVILVENLVLNDEESGKIPLKSFFADFVDNGGEYVAIVLSGQTRLTITAADAVTLESV